MSGRYGRYRMNRHCLYLGFNEEKDNLVYVIHVIM